HFANLRAFQLGWTSAEDYGSRCDFQCHEWVRNALSLVQRMPRLEELYLFASGVDAAKLFALKTLGSLRVLQVYHSYPYPLEKLAANPALGKLERLLLHPKAQGGWSKFGAYITLKGVKALVRSPHLKALSQLR